MNNAVWIPAEDAWILAHPDADHAAFLAAGLTPPGVTRTYHAFRIRRRSLQTGRVPTAPEITDNSVEPVANWREWNAWIGQGQALRKKARGSPREEAEIFIETDEDVAFIVLGDTHIGAWSSDHDLFERITDEILEHKLHIMLMGDMAHMAVKLRGVTEVLDNIIPAQEQLYYLSSWLEEVQDRVLAAIWGNHEIERAESQLGISPFGDLYRKTCRHYFNGIGHLSIRVNDQVYKIAASHHYQGRSIYNPVHGPQRYIVLQAPDREIALAGDSHVPGIMHFVQGAEEKLAVNCGSTQTSSGYAARYFSLTTHPVFPVVVLGHDRKQFRAHWNLAEYLAAKGAA